MKVQPDKIKHFVAWFIGTMLLLVLLYLIKADYYFLLANSIALGLGIAKEVYDCYKPNPTGFSIGDLIADVVAMIVANVVFIFAIWQLLG